MKSSTTSLREWLEARGEWSAVAAAMPRLEAAALWALDMDRVLPLEFGFEEESACLAVLHRSFRQPLDWVWEGVNLHPFWCVDVAGMGVTPKLIRSLHEAIWAWAPEQTIRAGEFLGALPWRWDDENAITAILRTAVATPGLVRPVRRHVVCRGQSSFISGWTAWQGWRSAQARAVKLATLDCTAIFARTARHRQRNLDLELLMASRGGAERILQLLALGADPNTENLARDGRWPGPAWATGTYLCAVRLPLAAAWKADATESLIRAGADPRKAFKRLDEVFDQFYNQAMKSGLQICRSLHQHPEWSQHHGAAREWLERVSTQLNHVVHECEDSWLYWHQDLMKVSELYGTQHRPCAEATAGLL